MTSDFSARLNRRNLFLLEIYEQLPGARWVRLSHMADEVVALRPIWRLHMFDSVAPSGLSELQIKLFHASRIIGRELPATSRGLNKAIRAAEEFTEVQ